MNTLFRILMTLLVALLGLWLLAEIVVRLYLEAPLKTDFYSSIPRQEVLERQRRYGVQLSYGAGWTHLGWIADPEQESYQVVKIVDGYPQEVGKSNFGSFLLHNAQGTYQVWTVPGNADPPSLLDSVEVQATPGTSPVHVPRITGNWQSLFKAHISGSYINDHTVYQDAYGDWRLVGITSHSDGDYNAERSFAVGVSPDFPPAEGMQEIEALDGYGELAWAPHVIADRSMYHIFWSPHKLHQMDSPDGVAWQEHQITMAAPFHTFFRDPMVLQVAENQWLLYTTARGAYYSQVDIYQSFDLQKWQYIRTTLRSAWGSERNSPFASMESPFVSEYQGHYYLSLTYNNDSFFWPGVLMLFKVWPDPQSYNDTLVFHSDNPYDFGVYRGKGRSGTLLTQLEAHAPEIIYQPEQDAWYITTAGWPWVATLTSGEVAVARLEWDPVP